MNHAIGVVNFSWNNNKSKKTADPIQSENKRKEADNLRRLVVDQSPHKNIKTLPVCVGWLDFLSSACDSDIYGW